MSNTHKADVISSTKINKSLDTYTFFFWSAKNLLPKRQKRERVKVNGEGGRRGRREAGERKKEEESGKKGEVRRGPRKKVGEQEGRRREIDLFIL